MLVQSGEGLANTQCPRLLSGLFIITALKSHKRKFFFREARLLEGTIGQNDITLVKRRCPASAGAEWRRAGQHAVSAPFIGIVYHHGLKKS